MSKFSLEFIDLEDGVSHPLAGSALGELLLIEQPLSLFPPVVELCRLFAVKRSFTRLFRGEKSSG